MEEQELIHRLRGGDDDAFETLFRTYFPVLCLFADNYVRNKQVAEEIVEDYFCHLWDSCHEISINISIKGYLYRSIRNRCLNYIRNQKVRHQYITDNPYYFTDDEILGSDTEELPVTNLITGELEKDIGKAIDSLPEQCRAVFCMNRFDNLTYNEIAAKLGITVNTVKTQMARALQKLRISLKDYLVVLFALILSLGRII